MTAKVLVFGGAGRVGGCVVRDIQTHAQAEVTVAGRRDSPPPKNAEWLRADADDRTALPAIVTGFDLVVHCAGPFRYRSTAVLEACIDRGVPYIDISDDPGFVAEAIALDPQARAAGITAVLSTGVFPGISNSMARQGVEALDEPTEIHLSYGVAGSGGAGVTVLRTTFLELQHPFEAIANGQWQRVKPYSDRETVVFPPPYGKAGVYWFSTVEAYSLPRSFPVQTVTTKFGSIPDFYNALTWLVAQLPPSWLQKPAVIEFLSQGGYATTQVLDRFTGVGLAMRSRVVGKKNGESAEYRSFFTHDNTAVAAGAGAGSVAELLLSGALQKPGVWVVEQALTTPQFLQTARKRDLVVAGELFS